MDEHMDDLSGGIFVGFTDRARKALALARQEAQRFNHEYISTEHILLGLIQEGSGVASNVLKNFDVELNKVRTDVEKLVQHGPPMVMLGQLPFTSGVKQVFALAKEESTTLGHNYVGTEHLLLGLIRESNGVAAQVLLALGLTLEQVRVETLEFLGADVPASPRSVPPANEERAKEPVFSLTRQNVRKQLARLPAAIEDAKKAGNTRTEGYLQGQQTVLRQLLEELTKSEDVPPGLRGALADVDRLNGFAFRANDLRGSWEEGVFSDAEFIQRVASLVREVRGEEPPD